MKKSHLFALAGLLLMVLPLPVRADDGAAQYNFASVQANKEIAIVSGKEGKGIIYFYNVDGNRITHITLAVSQAPSGWEVSIEPPLSERKFLVSDMPVTIAENLYVEPSELLAEEPEDVPEGMVSIKIPGRGYTLAKLAQVVISIPETASPGDTGEVNIAAEAFWLGQSGAAAVKQARDFDFAVTVVSGATEYTETIVSEEKEAESTTITEPEAPAPQPAQPAQPAPAITEPEPEEPAPVVQPSPAETVSPPGGESLPPENPIMDWLPVIIAGVVVILGAVLILALVARKRR